MGETPPAEQFSVPESTLPPTLELTCRRIFAATQMAASLGPGATLRSPLCRGRSAASLSAVSWGRSGGHGQGPWVFMGLAAQDGNQDPGSL